MKQFNMAGGAKGTKAEDKGYPRSKYELEGGVKHDDGKDEVAHMLSPLLAQSDLLPVWREIEKVLEHGAKKYPSKDNWTKVKPKERYLNAGLRHLRAHLDGEWTDNDSGRPHLAHMLASLTMYVAHAMKDRTK